MRSSRGKLAAEWATKGKDTHAPAPVEERHKPAVQSSVGGKKPRRPKGVGDAVGINLRMSPEAWTALGILAAKQRRAKQDLLLEALDLILAHYGEEPVARLKR